MSDISYIFRLSFTLVDMITLIVFLFLGCSHRRFHITADILYSFDCLSATDDISGTYNGLGAASSWISSYVSFDFQCKKNQNQIFSALNCIRVRELHPLEQNHFMLWSLKDKSLFLVIIDIDFRLDWKKNVVFDRARLFLE